MRGIVAVLALAALVGCKPYNGKFICAAPRPMDMSDTLANPPSGRSFGTQDEITRACIHRWAYRLAQSSERANLVADAVIGGCAEAVDIALSKRLQNEIAAREKSSAALKGVQPVNVMAVDSRTYRMAPVSVLLLRQYKELALFRVVQARAGNCEVPE